MATAKPAAAAPAEVEVPKKSKIKMIIIAAVVLAIAGGGGGAWYFMGHKAASGEHAKPAPIAPPVFLQIESFTVNLQSEEGERFLQTAFTIQVATPPDADAIKLYLPQVRSRVLLLLSSKRAADITTVEGKKKLANEILVQLKQPFSPGAQPMKVTDVFFTSFVVQ